MTYLEVALEIINKIKSYNFEAYIVGGYVRDYILNRSPQDIDITTSALPTDIMSIFKHVIPTGIDFEGVTVLESGYSFEITTYRKDISYYDHRHPTVAYASTLEEDLSRRDFTINAMCLDSNLKVIDLYNGINDLNNKIIRCVGDPNIRFYEDSLRILRAFYFSSKLNFDIESDTLKGIENNSKYLVNISGERIYNELKKLFNSKYVLKGLTYLSQSRALDYLPSLSKSTKLLVNNNEVVSFIEYLALSFYLEGYVNRYKLSRLEEKTIKNIIKLIDSSLDNYTIFKYTKEEIIYSNNLRRILNKEYDNNILTRLDKLPIKNIKELAISSKDLINIGLSGKDIGLTLEYLLKLVLNDNVENDKDILLKYIEKKEE